jgi:hypothetical protein
LSRAGAGGCCSCVVWMQRQDIPLAVPAVPDSPLTARFVSLRRVEMVWSTRHQDSKLIDVCTGANPACARNAGEHLLLCFPSHEWSPRLLAARGPARGRPEPALAIWLRRAVQTMCVLPHAPGQTAVCPSPCAHCLPYKHAALLLRMSPAPPTGTNCVLCGTVT